MYTTAGFHTHTPTWHQTYSENMMPEIESMDCRVYHHHFTAAKRTISVLVTRPSLGAQVHTSSWSHWPPEVWSRPAQEPLFSGPRQQQHALLLCCSRRNIAWIFTTLTSPFDHTSKSMSSIDRSPGNVSWLSLRIKIRHPPSSPSRHRSARAIQYWGQS